MQNSNENPYSALERVFHEPNRLAIMSALADAADGMTFRDLKEKCALTDGNLSRHVKTLEEAGMVKIRKTFVGVRPQTTIALSGEGRRSFINYLKALEEVLQKAASALKQEKKPVTGMGFSAKAVKG